MVDKWRESLLNVRRIVVHGNCSDGISSALIIRDVLSNATVEFVEHGQSAYNELEVSSNMLFCDICPPRGREDEFVDADAIVLDHHRSAQDIVRKFGANGRFADEDKEPGVSGAVLAFREVWCVLEDLATTSKVEVEDFARLAGVRDTWQRDDRRWEDACVQAEVLRFFGQEYWVQGDTQTHAARIYPEEDAAGRFLYQQRRKVIQNLVDSACVYKVKRLKVAVFNDAECYCSDVAEVLRKEKINIIVGFTFSKSSEGEPLLKYSLRSDSKFDVAAFAKVHGGGGHSKSAAFTLHTELNPFVDIMDKLRLFLKC